MTQDILASQFEEPNPAHLIADLRQKVLDGIEPSSEEYRLVLQQLRRSRTAAPSSTGRKKVTTAPVDLDAEFS